MLQIKTLKVGAMESNCYILYETGYENCLIIDAGDDSDYIINTLSLLNIKPEYIIATHGHFDHNMAAFELQIAFNIPFLISEKDEFLLKKIPDSAKHFLNISSVKVPKTKTFLKKNKKINIGSNFLEVIELPGHTPGSIGLYNPIEKILFSGDTIFDKGKIGRYDFSYSSRNNLLSSIDKILSLPNATIIYPGHGDITSVKKEIAYHR